MDPNITKPLHIIFHKINGYIKDFDRSKHLKLIPTDEKNKKVLKNMT